MHKLFMKPNTIVIHHRGNLGTSQKNYLLTKKNYNRSSFIYPSHKDYYCRYYIYITFSHVAVTNLVASHHTTAAHHPWTTTPIIHCTTTHTVPSTIAPITQLSPISNQP